MILSFALTTKEFLEGKKTCTRRFWKPRTLKMWQKAFDEGRLIHDAADKVLFAGGKRIGKFKLTDRPYLEKLGDMPESDLEAEGGMCKTLDDFYKLIRPYFFYDGTVKSKEVAVVRFKRIELNELNV